MNRLPFLDYLRGVAAFTIMIYHYILFTMANPETNSLLKKAGLYGVSVFYILSGLTLFHVYAKSFKLRGPDLFNFFSKRFFRIFPLLWLVTLLTIYFKGFPGFGMLFLNLTGLFGLVNPSAYIATGVWSIGNELVFYLVFPFFIFLVNFNKALFYFVSGVLLTCYLYFAFIELPRLASIAKGWDTYINPLNQIFLFVCGIAIGVLSRDKRINQLLLAGLFFLALGLFIFYPVHGDALNLVIREPRLIYTCLCIIIVLCAYKFEVALPDFINKPLLFLGEISYGLYLLHPLVLIITQIAFSIIAKYIFAFPNAIMLVCSGIASLIVSYLVYNFFERPFVRLGKRLTT